MKNKKEVIFLIDPEQYDKHMLGLTIEKRTKCRVFNFFSIEETLLYKNLNPKLIVHDKSNLEQKFYGEDVSFFDISKSLNLEHKSSKTKSALHLANQMSALIKAQ